MTHDKDDDYWIVSLKAYAFDTEQEARAYRDALCDAFTAMPESASYGSAVDFYHASEDPAEALTAAQAEIERLEGAIMDWYLDPSIETCGALEAIAAAMQGGKG